MVETFVLDVKTVRMEHLNHNEKHSTETNQDCM